MPRLNEAEKRRPDFRDGAPVTMADGQVWYLRKPRLRPVPTRSDSTRALGYCLPGVNFQALLDRVTECQEFYRALADLSPEEQEKAADANPQHDLGVAEFAAGRAMLDANYDLTHDEAVGILQMGYDPGSDPEGAALRDAVMGVAWGHAEKPQPGTPDSA